MKELLFHLSQYNYWANTRLLADLVGGLEDTLTDKPVPSSFPGLKKTVRHIWDAETIWLMRLEGSPSPSWPPNPVTGAGIRDLTDHALLQSEKLVSYVRDASEELLGTRFDYRNTKGTVYTSSRASALLHCFNHSTFHRGQVVTILRALDVTTIPSTDYIAFCRQS